MISNALVVWLQLLGVLSLEIGVIAGVAALLEHFTVSAPWRRTIWQICILAALALLIVEFSGTARPWRRWTAPRRITPAARLQPAPVQPRRPSPVGVPLPSQNTSVAGPIQPPPAPSLAPLETVESATPQAPGLPARSTPRDISSSSILLPAFELAWVLGTAIVLGRMLVFRALFFLLRHERKPVADPRLRERLQSLAVGLGLRREIRLIESDCFLTPVAFGLFKPAIGLPVRFTVRFNCAQQEAMLLHELAHLWACDPAWHLLADLATAALWWHPLVWWMRRQLGAASETAADEATLLIENGPGILAECLVAFGSRLAPRSSLGILGIGGAGFRSGLGRRVERLIRLDDRAWIPPCPQRSLLAKSLGPLALVIAAILSTAWAVPPALTKEESMQTMKQTWKNSLSAVVLMAGLGSDQHLTQANPSLTAPEAVIAAPENETLPPAPSPRGANKPVDLTPAKFAPASAYAKPGDLTREMRTVNAKLENVTLDSVRYDRIPLSEVIHQLAEVSGVNFILDRGIESPKPGDGPVDPATGLPVSVRAAEPAEVGAAIIQLDPPLKHVRVIDVLNAITKVSDKPIKYAIEDYGVVISLDPTRLVEPRSEIDPRFLELRTFKLDTNSIYRSLQSVFGTQLPAGPAAGQAFIPQALKEALARELNIRDISVFYNSANGVLLVRGTHEDVETVEAVVKTLGGAVYSGPQTTARFSGDDALRRTAQQQLSQAPSDFQRTVMGAAPGAALGGNNIIPVPSRQ